MKLYAVLVIAVALLLSSCGAPSVETTETSVARQPADTSPEITETTAGEKDPIAPVEQESSIMLKRDIFVLMMAYPGHVAGAERADNQVWLVMKSGQRILYDDQKEKSDDEKLVDADLQDALETHYPLDELNTLMDPGMDPGRVRAYPLFDEIYGHSQDTISKKLVPVDFGKEYMRFNREAGAAAALASAAAGAADLIFDQPDIAEFLYPTSGTFNYRVIAGTNRLSPHAYGIAIDLKSSADGYWRWAEPDAGEELIRHYPADLVRLFEKHGFIWGGKWHHFDIFHFEYRPELILKATYFSTKIDPARPWHDGVDTDNETIRKVIKQIDKSLG